MKQCKKCSLVLDFSKFSKKQANKDGYANDCKDCRRNDKLKYKYGIDSSEYNLKLKQQNYKCVVCGVEENKDGTRLCVDHCHSTGKVRDLLCSRCNAVLGLVDEDTDRLIKLKAYLQKHSFLS